jgi:hypothetical protein
VPLQEALSQRLFMMRSKLWDFDWNFVEKTIPNHFKQTQEIRQKMVSSMSVDHYLVSNYSRS